MDSVVSLLGAFYEKLFIIFALYVIAKSKEANQEDGDEETDAV